MVLAGTACVYLQVVCRLRSYCGQWLAVELQECGDAGDPRCAEYSLSLRCCVLPVKGICTSGV